MVVYYGMGELVIYPSGSEKYKEMIDNEIIKLIEDAYGYAEFIIRHAQDLIKESAELLKDKKMLHAEELNELIQTKYSNVLDLIINE
jgi:ATP-dependent Zn protease